MLPLRASEFWKGGRREAGDEEAHDSDVDDEPIEEVSADDGRFTVAAGGRDLQVDGCGQDGEDDRD
jgi:hypothetical protein